MGFRQKARRSERQSDPWDSCCSDHWDLLQPQSRAVQATIQVTNALCRVPSPEPRVLQTSLRWGALRTVQQNEASSNPASDPVLRVEQYGNRGVSEFAKVSSTCGDTDDLTAARGRWEAQRATKQTRLNCELLGPLSTKRTAQAQESWEKFVKEREQESLSRPGLAGERTSPSLSLAESIVHQAFVSTSGSAGVSPRDFCSLYKGRGK